MDGGLLWLKGAEHPVIGEEKEASAPIHFSS